MRLVNIDTLRLRSFGDDPPLYATLSHRWTDCETTYEEFIDDYSKKGDGYKKFQDFCKIVRSFSFHNFASYRHVQWCWIDTCCIDKRSSAELSEAINSMARIYQKSTFCVAHLSDVEHVACETQEQLEDRIRRSEWFTRGWTLQELLFPPRVVFCDRDWKLIPGLDTAERKARDILSEVTRIPPECFGETKLIFKYSVATRMTWASRRFTTRIEDRAYSLLGLFKINMPLLYGEGENAFYRLQEQIIGKYDDETVFCWTTDTNSDHCPILSSSPDDFNRGPSDRMTLYDRQPLRITNRGLEIEAEGTLIRWMKPQQSDEKLFCDEFTVIPLNAYSYYMDGVPHSWYIALRKMSHLPFWYRIYAFLGRDELWDYLARQTNVVIRKLPMMNYYVATTRDQLRDFVPVTRNHPVHRNLVTYEKLTESFALANDEPIERDAAVCYRSDPTVCPTSPTGDTKLRLDAWLAHQTLQNPELFVRHSLPASQDTRDHRSTSHEEYY